MQRYNPFTQTYNVLQDLLFQSAGSLRQMLTGRADEATAARQQATDAILFFDRQVQAVEALFCTVADLYEPAIVDAVRQQHAAAAKSRKALLQILQKENEIFSWPQTFSQAMVQWLHCLLKGEALLLPVLWRYYSDAELKELDSKLLSLAEPAQLQRA